MAGAECPRSYDVLTVPHVALFFRLFARVAVVIITGASCGIGHPPRSSLRRGERLMLAVRNPEPWRTWPWPAARPTPLLRGACPPM
jgi:hypothetical protein